MRDRNDPHFPQRTSCATEKTLIRLPARLGERLLCRLCPLYYLCPTNTNSNDLKEWLKAIKIIC